MSRPVAEISSSVGAFTAEAFAAHLAAQAASPAWWLDLKRAAYEKFASLPMPKRTDETWRFSNIGGLNLDSFKTGAPPTLSNAPVELGAPAALSFVNNRISRRTALPAALAAQGVIVSTLAEAAATHADILRKHFMAQPQRLGSEKFAALHAAFVEDGAFIYVPRGVEIAQPIVIAHATDGSPAFPHTLVVAEENSKITVVDLFQPVSGRAETPLGTPDSCLAVGANDLYAGHGSAIVYVGVQNWSRSTLSFQLNSTVVRRDARVQSLNLHLGARQARHESLSQLQAPGAFSEMLALTAAEADQEFDQRTLQIHQAPNTKSDLLYKNALLDRSKTIFSGLIIVDPDAQKTDAYQSNRNLMLSDDAEANSLPGLEIQANDVRCTHGATTSRIDPEQEFYLLSRGIDATRASRLLVFGFFEEVLNRLENAEIHARLSRMIEAKFKAMPPAGPNRKK
jgi:Fe-S cluster assembly protein SufD